MRRRPAPQSVDESAERAQRLAEQMALRLAVLGPDEFSRLYGQPTPEVVAALAARRERQRAGGMRLRRSQAEGGAQSD